jgi:isochorismate pyruvate lyase
MMKNPDLALLRNEIDNIDRELVQLLARRFRTVDRVVVTKQKACLPATIAARVDEVISNARKVAAEKGVPPETAERLWRLLVDETIRYERSQGVPGN